MWGKVLKRKDPNRVPVKGESDLHFCLVFDFHLVNAYFRMCKTKIWSYYFFLKVTFCFVRKTLQNLNSSYKKY